MMVAPTECVKQKLLMKRNKNATSGQRQQIMLLGRWSMRFVLKDSPSLVEAPTVTELTAGWVSKCSIKEMTKLKPQKMTKVYKIHLEKKLDMLVDKDLKDNYDRIEVEELLQVGLLCTLSTSQATGQKCLKWSQKSPRKWCKWLFCALPRNV